jgi:hypothetical protein
VFVVDLRYGSLKLPFGRRGRIAIRFACELALLLGIPVVGQSPYPQFPSTNNGKFGQNYPDSTSPFGAEPALDDKRLRQLNLERQRELVSDTARLLQLAKELNDEMTGDPPMTDAQMRKVAEIGKLAKSVKEKMSYTLGAYPGVKGPQNPSIQ